MARNVTLADFLGTWVLSRRIEDLRLGLRGNFAGSAVFEPSGSLVLQREEGVLRFGDAPPMQATRRYLWDEADGRIVLQFEDGRPFHDFQADGSALATHLCGADNYNVRYDFTEWPVWRSQWQVTGPRKDLILSSQFSRDSPSGFVGQ